MTGPTAVITLTARETTVLRLVAKGLVNKEVASESGLSPNTIRSHMRSIFAKLAVDNRIQAINKAREIGVEL